jgi:isoamylase
MTNMPEDQKIRPGSPRPLGATWDGEGTNFAVYSADATGVDICIYDGDDEEPSRVISLPEQTYFIWHGYVPGPGTRYGLRVHGPWEPGAGLRFNPNKVLLDPYAKAIDGTVTWDDSLFSYEITEDQNGHTMSETRNDGFMPKALVVDPSFDWEGDTLLYRNWYDTVIYEVHVKGFTHQHPDIPEDIRGTYKGLAHPAAIEHLTNLGVTAVELLPVHTFVDDQFLTDQGLTNYWGYSTLGFFSPDSRYAADKADGSQVNEFREMVKAFHAAGIEVILDVVFNHTCEGNHLGPSLSFKGIDCRSYYRLVPEDPYHFIDFTGTGNTVDASNPQVLTMILDSLRYWVTEMHVDGFRFDLAVTLGREDPDFLATGGFFDAIHQDPVLSQVKLIAEPWDIGPDGYQVGQFPMIWSEWNDKFRDDVRTFWQTTQPILSAMGFRLTASADQYEWNGRKPKASINLITAHDGFCLHDLVSYTRKHNEANGEDNEDGHDHNISANYGHEGPTDDPDIIALRERQKRNMLATLIFSQGIPMICGGDELGRTQQGNNNAYAQDNEISWFDWDLDDDQNALIEFTKNAIAVRQANPALKRRLFFEGLPQKPGSLKDVTWFHPEGWELSDNDWSNPDLRTIGARLAGDAIEEIDEEGNPLRPSSVFLIFHAGEDDIEFMLPLVERAQELNQWTALLSTDSPDGAISRSARARSRITVPGRTVMIFSPSEDLTPDSPA